MRDILFPDSKYGGAINCSDFKIFDAIITYDVQVHYSQAWWRSV